MNRTPRNSAAPGMTPLEYAREHGVTIDWVYRLIRVGRLPHVRMLDRIFIPRNQKAEDERANS